MNFSTFNIILPFKGRNWVAVMKNIVNIMKKMQYLELWYQPFSSNWSNWARYPNSISGYVCLTDFYPFGPSIYQLHAFSESNQWWVGCPTHHILSIVPSPASVLNMFTWEYCFKTTYLLLYQRFIKYCWICFHSDLTLITQCAFSLFLWGGWGNSPPSDRPYRTEYGYDATNVHMV